MINDLGMGIVVTMRDMFSRNAAKIESAMRVIEGTARSMGVTVVD